MIQIRNKLDLSIVSSHLASSIVICLCVICVMPAVLIRNNMVSGQNSSRYDSSRISINKQELQKAIRLNVQKPVEMYNLLRRAQKWNLRSVAFSTLKDLRKEQKNNAVVAASYALAVDMLKGDYSSSLLERYSFSKTDIELREKSLQDAYRLDPDLWLTYAVDGYSEVIKGTKDSAAHGRKLLQKAVKLAPDVSFVHHSLGIAYSSGNHTELFEQKVKEYELAQKLKPVMVEASMSLFNVYVGQRPDAKKAKAAAEAVIRALPPGAKVGPKTRARFAKYGVTVPWK